MYLGDSTGWNALQAKPAIGKKQSEIDNDPVKGSFQHDKLATMARATCVCILVDVSMVHSDSISVAVMWYNYTLTSHHGVGSLQLPLPQFSEICICT